MKEKKINKDNIIQLLNSIIDISNNINNDKKENINKNDKHNLNNNIMAGINNIEQILKD